MEGRAHLGAARGGFGTVTPGDAHDAHDGQYLEIPALRAENARLITLLESHGIEWRQPQRVASMARDPESSKLSTVERSYCSVDCFAGARMFTRSVGSASPPVSLATRQGTLQ